MIDFEVAEELALLSETARGLARDHLLPSLREAEAARSVAAGARAAHREIGLAGLELPESAGGAGLGALARVLVNEELGAADPGAALALDPLGLALYPLLEVGGEAAAAALFEALSQSDGRAVGILADDAPDGSDEPDLRVDLREGQADVEVAWAPADRVDALVVLLRDEALWIDEGLACQPLRGAGLRAAGACALRARGAPVRARFESRAGAVRARARGRLYVASLLLGVMRAACDFSRGYAQEREAFGRPIGHHQALAFLITDMQMALDGARLLVQEAAWRIDRGEPAAAEAAGAYAQCIEAARFVGPAAVQILGGHGFMADYPVEKHMREARALGLLWGGLDAAVEEAGRTLVLTDAPLALCGGAS